MEAKEQLGSNAVSGEGLRRPRVLAVEDQRDTARLLQLQLRSAGIDCFLCYDGPSALELVAAQPVDVIILDIMMPQMDGFEVCRRLKADERTRDIPILFLTAKLDVEDKVEALAIGGHDYLTKPVQHQELLARTRAALRVKFLQDQLKEKLLLQREVDRLHQDMVGQHWQKTLGQLAASLAHEINNPLAAALGLVQLMALQESGSSAVQQRLQSVDQSLQRAARKLRSLLLIAQLGEAAQKIDLAQLVSDVLVLANYQVLVSGVTVQTDFDPACHWLGPPGDLARAVWALINNGIEAVENTPHPALLVQVKSDGPRRLIRIADNGPGIPDAIRERIFEPFFTTKSQLHHGVGLGLAREIVRAGGGTIEFQCPGPLGGAEFVVALPARA